MVNAWDYCKLSDLGIFNYSSVLDFSRLGSDQLYLIILLSLIVNAWSYCKLVDLGLYSQVVYILCWGKIEIDFSYLGVLYLNYGRLLVIDHPTRVLE